MVFITELFEIALKARNMAYAPYSNFKVGAALLTTDNQIYVGANVENVSFPCGTCAEQSAIAAMISGGGKTIKEIVIVAESKTLIAPCGACLQRISEFSDDKTVVHLANLDGVQKSYPLGALFPVAFKQGVLKKDD
ncbi:MAG: cytidine deaminase [Alphaproteobacteria bacterium]|nr:cytidine deaminase [Alphaproteobacteria bacterium]